MSHVSMSSEHALTPPAAYDAWLATTNSKHKQPAYQRTSRCSMPLPRWRSLTNSGQADTHLHPDVTKSGLCFSCGRARRAGRAEFTLVTPISQSRWTRASAWPQLDAALDLRRPNGLGRRFHHSDRRGSRHASQAVLAPRALNCRDRIRGWYGGSAGMIPMINAVHVDVASLSSAEAVRIGSFCE